MKKINLDWFAKAEEDLSVAVGLIRRRRIPADAVCFHCQQVAEKYLKGLLQENRIRFGKTHDLVELCELAKPVAPTLSLLQNDFESLSDYAVNFRYPGFDATPAAAKAAVAAAKRIRAAIRVALG
jgi:HEPN domain-containing protein